MNVIHIDRRADHVVLNRPRVLDAVNDIDALAAEQGRHLERAHEAFWRNDASVFLDAITKTNERRMAIRVISEDLACVVESAPVIPTDQLAIWLAA